MYGEPSAYEYAKMLGDANAAISTDGFKCFHNNTGWLGYYITTPKGNKYQLVKKDAFRDTGYNLCEYTPQYFECGKSLGLSFKDLDECKEYLLTKENEECSEVDAPQIIISEDEKAPTEKKLTLKEVVEMLEHMFGFGLDSDDRWTESEIKSLIEDVYAVGK